jgi:O-antigen/teichoic acid export membrane protein
VGWYYRDETVFAIFRYGSREFPLATALATALGAAMTARLTEAPEPGFRELKAKTTRLMHWVFPPTLALLFLSGYLFPRVFNPDFAASAPLFNIYLLMTASRVLLPNAVALSVGKSRVIFMAGVLELIVKIVLGFIFIQNWGLAGVAWSAVAAFWVEKLALIGYLETRENIRTDRWLDLKWYLLYTCILLSGYFIIHNSFGF